MGTECSYDYIFVYDGDSFKSPLLGSFSGKTEPQKVVATSGSVSILKQVFTFNYNNFLLSIVNQTKLIDYLNFLSFRC